MTTTISSRIEYLPRSSRRMLVAAALLGYPVAVAVLVGLKHTSLNKWLILAVFLVIVLAVTVLVTVGYVYARGRIEGRCARLDERDLALRQQAYALSHRTLAVILIAVTAGLTIYLTGGNTVRLDANSFWPVVMWVVVYIPALPALMLAWIETDQPADV
ncbi:MAG TPA: hypothetical protein VEV45_08960 [Streptosporangiaceae bacterium]|nr:hypothetical protein [Streptosporangiaceae bacterium]